MPANPRLSPQGPALTRPRQLVPWVAGGLLVLVLVSAAWWWQQGRSQPSAVAPAAGAVATVAALAAPAALPAPIETAQAVGASYQELLSGSSTDWRVARLALNPKILVIEFPSLAVQGHTMNRLGALIEKHLAPRDVVLSNEKLARFIQQTGDTAETFYFGHDYPAEAVARFFTLAVNQQILLNPDEIRLGNLLLSAKVLNEENDRLSASPDRMAVVSFTALQPDNPRTPTDETVDAARREAVLRHELSHGEFFTNAAYRAHCWSFWQKLSDDERAAFRGFLTRLDYDPTNEELMVNETQAFLMHTPDRRSFSSQVFGVSQARIDSLRTRFKEGLPPSIFSSIGMVEPLPYAQAPAR